MIARLAYQLWPRSLANRTALALLLGLSLVQAAGLLASTLGRMDLLRLAQAQDLGQRIDNVYRSVVMAAPQDRQAALRELDAQSDLVVTLDPEPATSDLEPSPPPVQRHPAHQPAVCPGAARRTLDRAANPRACPGSIAC